MLSNTYLTKIFVVAFVFIVLPLGLFVCKKLYDKMKNEEHREKGKVIQTIIKNHCLIQMIAWPTLCLFSLLIFLNNDTFHFIDPFKTIFAIQIFRCLYHFFRVYLSFHSLIVAIARYSFLMYDIQTDIIGIPKLRSLFISCRIGVPIMHSILYACTATFQVRWILLFAIRNNSMSIPSEQHGFFSIQVTEEKEYNNLLYNIIKNLMPPQVIFGLQLFEAAIFILIASNIIEGFLYTHLFIHFHR